METNLTYFSQKHNNNNNDEKKELRNRSYAHLQSYYKTKTVDWFSFESSKNPALTEAKGNLIIYITFSNMRKLLLASAAFKNTKTRLNFVAQLPS